MWSKGLINSIIHELSCKIFYLESIGNLFHMKIVKRCLFIRMNKVFNKEHSVFQSSLNVSDIKGFGKVLSLIRWKIIA